MRWYRHWTHSLWGGRASTSTLKMNCRNRGAAPTSQNQKYILYILTIYWMTFGSDHFYFCTVWSARSIMLSCCLICVVRRVFFCSCFFAHQYLRLHLGFCLFLYSLEFRESPIHLVYCFRTWRVCDVDSFLWRRLVPVSLTVKRPQRTVALDCLFWVVLILILDNEFSGFLFKNTMYSYSK